MPEARFRILTEYKGAEFERFRKDIKSIQDAIQGIEKITQSAAGLNKAAEYVSNFVLEIGKLRGANITQFKDISKSMKDMADSTKKLSGATTEIKKFTELIFDLGGAIRSTKTNRQDWQVGIENMKQVSGAIRQIGSASNSLAPIEKLVTLLRSGSSTKMVDSLLNLQPAVTYTGQIAENLARIKNLGAIDLRYGSGGGAIGGGRRGAEAIATPIALPGVYDFRDPEIQGKISRSVEKLMAGPGAMGGKIDDQYEIANRFMTQISGYESENVDQWKHMVEYTGKLLGIRRRGTEDEAAYFDRMRVAYEESYGKFKGLTTASGVAGMASGMLFSEYTPGKGAAPMEMAGMRGTIIHRGVEKSLGRMMIPGGVSGEARYLTAGTQKLIMRYGDAPEQIAALQEQLKATAEAGAKELEAAAYKAGFLRPEDQQWIQREANKIRQGIPKAVNRFIKFLREQAMQVYRGDIREGVKNIQVGLETAMPPMQLIPPGTGDPLKRTPAQFQGVVKDVMRNLGGAMGKTGTEDFTRIVNAVGLNVGGIMDIIGKIGSKGFVMDLKTGGQGLESLKYVLVQLRDMYMRGAKGVFPGTDFQGFALTTEGQVKDITRLEREAEEARKSRKVLTAGGDIYGKREGIPGDYRTGVTQEIAGALSAERVSGLLGGVMAGEHLSTAEALEKVEARRAEWTKKRADEEKKSSIYGEAQLRDLREINSVQQANTEAVKQEAAATQQITQARDRMAAGAGGAGRPPGGGEGGGPGGIYARLGPGTDPMMLTAITTYEKTLNKAALEAIAFNRELDLTIVKTKLINNSISSMSGALARVVELEAVRKDDLFNKHAAYEKLTDIVKEYATLQEKLAARETRAAEITMQFGGQRGYDEATRELRRRLGGSRKTIASEALSPIDEENLRRIDKAQKSMIALDAEFEIAAKEVGKYGDAMVRAFRGGAEPTSDLERRLRVLYEALKISGEEVGTIDDVMRIFANTSKKMASDVQTGARSFKTLEAELDRLAGVYNQVKGSQEIYKLSGSKLAVAQKIMQQRVRLLTSELEKTTEAIFKEEQASKRDRAEIKRLTDQHTILEERLNRVQKEASEVNRELVRQRGSAENLRGSLRTTLAGFKDMLKSQAAWVAGYGLMFGAIRKFREALGSVVVLEQQLARAMRTTRSEIQSTVQIYEGYREAAVGVMIRLGRTAEEAGEVLYQLGSAGLTAEESIAALQSTMDAIVGTEGDVTTYTKAVASTYNNFAETITHVTSTQEKFKYINDVMVATFREHQVEINELTEGLKHLTSMGKASGLRFVEMSGILATLNDHMIKSGMAGRSVQSILSRISRQGREFARAFDIEIDMTKPIDFIKIILDVNEKMAAGQLTADQVGLIFEKLGLRGAKAFTMLVQHVDELIYNIRELESNSKGAASQMANIMTATPEGELRKMGQLFAEIARQFFGIYVEAARVSAVIINNFSAAMIKASNDANLFPKIVKDGTTAIKDFSIGTLNAVGVMTILSAAFKRLVGVRLFEGGLIALLAKINLTTVAVGALLGVSYALWNIWRKQAQEAKKTADEAAKLRIAYEGQRTALQALVDKHRVLTRTVSEYSQLSQNEKRALMASNIELIESVDRQGEAHIKTKQAIVEETTAIEEQIREARNLASIKLMDTAIKQLEAASKGMEKARRDLGRYREAQESLKGGIDLGDISDPAFSGAVDLTTGSLVKFFLQIAKGDTDVGNLAESLDSLEVLHNALRTTMRNLEQDGKKTSDLYKDMSGAVDELGIVLDSLNRVVREEAWMAQKLTIKDVEADYQNLAGQVMEARKSIEDFYEYLQQHSGEAYETLFKVKLEGLSKDQIVEIIKDMRETTGTEPLEIKTILTAVEKGFDEKMLTSAFRELLNITEETRGKMLKQIDADEELLKGGYSRAEIAKTVNELLENGMNIQEVSNKKIAQIINGIIQNKLKIINLDDQNEKLMQSQIAVIDQIRNRTEKLATTGMPTGLAQQINQIRDQAEAQRRAVEQSVQSTITTIEQRAKKDMAIEVVRVEKIKELRNEQSKFEIELEKSTQKQIERTRADADIKYKRSVKDREIELQKLSLEVKKYLTTQEEWKLKEIDLEEAIRKTQRTIEDLKLGNDRFKDSIVILQAKYDMLKATQEKLEATGGKLTEQQEKDLDLWKNTINMLLEAIEENKDLIEVYEKLKEIRKAGIETAKEEFDIEKKIQKLRSRAEFFGGGRTVESAIIAGRARAEADYYSKIEALKEAEIKGWISSEEKKKFEIETRCRLEEDVAKNIMDYYDDVKERYIQNLATMSEYNILFVSKTLDGLEKIKKVMEGMWKGFSAGVLQATEDMLDVKEFMAEMGQTITEGLGDVAFQGIFPDDEAIAQAKGEVIEIQNTMNETLAEVSQLQQEMAVSGATPEQLQRMDELTRSLDEQTNSLREARGAVDELQDGWKRAGKALEDLTRVVIREIQKQITEMMVALALKQALGWAGIGFETGGKIPIPKMKNKAHGGLIELARMQSGGTLGIPGRDSVPVLAMPGEYFINKDAVDYYGADYFENLNKMKLPRRMGFGGFIRMQRGGPPPGGYGTPLPTEWTEEKGRVEEEKARQEQEQQIAEAEQQIADAQNEINKEMAKAQKEAQKQQIKGTASLIGGVAAYKYLFPKVAGWLGFGAPAVPDLAAAIGPKTLEMISPKIASPTVTSGGGGLFGAFTGASPSVLSAIGAFAIPIAGFGIVTEVIKALRGEDPSMLARRELEAMDVARMEAQLASLAFVQQHGYDPLAYATAAEFASNRIADIDTQLRRNELEGKTGGNVLSESNIQALITQRQVYENFPALLQEYKQLYSDFLSTIPEGVDKEVYRRYFDYYSQPMATTGLLRSNTMAGLPFTSNELFDAARRSALARINTPNYGIDPNAPDAATKYKELFESIYGLPVNEYTVGKFSQLLYSQGITDVTPYTQGIIEEGPTGYRQYGSLSLSEQLSNWLPSGYGQQDYSSLSERLSSWLPNVYSVREIFQRRRKGGIMPIRKMQRGGKLIGGVPGIDSIPIMASPGEYFIRKEAVDFYGKETFDKLNNTDIPSYQRGGMVASRVKGFLGGPQIVQNKTTIKGGDNFYFIQATDMDSFRRLIQNNSDVVRDISMAGMFFDIDNRGPVSRKVMRR